MSSFIGVEYLYDWTVISLVTLHNYIFSHEDGASQDSNQLMILRILGGGGLVASATSSIRDTLSTRGLVPIEMVIHTVFVGEAGVHLLHASNPSSSRHPNVPRELHWRSTLQHDRLTCTMLVRALSRCSKTTHSLLSVVHTLRSHEMCRSFPRRTCPIVSCAVNYYLLSHDPGSRSLNDSDSEGVLANRCLTVRASRCPHLDGAAFNPEILSSPASLLRVRYFAINASTHICSSR